MREKGDSLERAVRAIESVILESFPADSENTFRIEGKRILRVSGVRHEIDVYVVISRSKGYDSIFIFECKNWLEKVGKNELIVFSEKVRACNAQKGFFIARSYTQDAKAQAKLDPRVEILVVDEQEQSAVIVPGEFHGIQIGEKKATVTFKAAHRDSETHRMAVDLRNASFVLRGVVTDADQFVRIWIDELANSRCSRFPSNTVEEGRHLLDFAAQREFDEGQAFVNGRPVRSIETAGTVEVDVRKAVVLSAFDIATRGRCMTIMLEMPDASISADFVQTYPPQVESP